MPVETGWSCHIDDTPEVKQAKERDEVDNVDAFLNTWDMNDDDDEEPVRIARIKRQEQRAEKELKTPRQSRGPRDTASRTPATGGAKKRKLDEMAGGAMQMRRPADKAAQEKLQEKIRRKELEIMHGGRYYKMKDDANERDKAMRDAKRNKMEGREHIDRAMRPQDIEVLDQRQQRIKELAKAFYATNRHEEAVGEVVTVVQTHNIGYIELLGEPDMLPIKLREDGVFVRAPQRRVLFDGTSLLHQSIMIGDMVRFRPHRYFSGTDVGRDEKKRFRGAGDDTRWMATDISIFEPDEMEIPFKNMIIPQEVRKYMLSLLYLMEAGQDLALYTKIVQELELWKRIMGEPYTNQPHGGLMKWHVFLILAISSRRWLAEVANMPILLWSFYNSFTGTRFLEKVLPHLLRLKELNASAVLQLVRFVYLYKKNTAENVTALVELLKESRWVFAQQNDPENERVFDETLRDLQEIEGERHTFVSLLQEACDKGFNPLRIKNKEELEDVDEIIHNEKGGHRYIRDGLDPLPTLAEFADEDALEPSRLVANKAEGSWGTPENYTRAAFQLLRADTYKEYQFSMHNKIYNWAQYENSEDVSFKREVGRPTSFMRLIGILGVNYTGSALAGRLCYTVRFRLYEPMQEAWLFRMYGQGNLVGLTIDRFKERVWWAVVSHRDQVLLSQGIVGLEFISGDPLELQAELQELQRTGRDSECWIVEAKTIFFTGARPVLEALQQFSRNSMRTGHCPFEDWLVYGRDPKVMPPWVQHNEDMFRMELRNCKSENTFDASQERAIEALQNSFVLVQGPPGTGKSYTGVKMVDVILRTRYAALDQMNRRPEIAKIARRMQEAREAHEQYHHLQNVVEKLKEKIISLKKMRDKQKDPQRRKDYRNEINHRLEEREVQKKKMREIDSKQSKIFEEIIELEQSKERAFRDWERDSGPIQIITYKNHSLDEFLMDVKPSVRNSVDDPSRKEGLVRFGSRSLAEELDQYNVMEHVRRYELQPNMISYQKLLSMTMRNKVDLLKNIGAEISHLQGGNLTVECMKCMMTEAQLKNFGDITEARITAWRGVPYNEVLLSLEDTARAALDKDKLEADSDGDSDDGMPKVNDLQTQRDMYQTKAEQEEEDRGRNRFMGGFSPVLPDQSVPNNRGISFDPSIVDDLNTLPESQRDELARVWIQRHLRSVIKTYQKLKAEYIYLVASQYEFRQQTKVDALQHAQVIGLTVTGCTINKELLNDVKPTILIVEEAAEILESQIISCLNQKSIQQVVLIGDHKQLKPIVSNYDIAKNCKLDLSLFERMANNHVTVHNLTNQRRMVPEISQFVRPLYRQLIDDQCLKPRKLHCDRSGEVRPAGDIPGLGKPVWFWAHDCPEEKSAVGLSVINPMEVKMIVWLARFFVARGMSLGQITVLTPYKGQARELTDALQAADHFRPDMVCTVDRFQGDENDLMLISLVRTMKLTEFIKAPDRMCVLLSRARFGNVILGSANLLDTPEVPHWQTTMATLAQNNWIGPRFPMQCNRHPHARTNGLTVEDLMSDSADAKIDGFCRETCGAKYRACMKPDLHRCPRLCHHGEHAMCDHICNSQLPCGHTCRQECGECFSNGCRCTDTIAMDAECGVFERVQEGRADPEWRFVKHTLSKVGCQADFKRCEREVWVRLPCGHYGRSFCHIPFDPNTAPCRDCAAHRAVEPLWDELPDLIGENPRMYEIEDGELVLPEPTQIHAGTHAGTSVAPTSEVAMPLLPSAASGVDVQMDDIELAGLIGAPSTADESLVKEEPQDDVLSLQVKQEPDVPMAPLTSYGDADMPPPLPPASQVSRDPTELELQSVKEEFDGDEEINPAKRRKVQ